jgi:hypothetical protein
VMLREAYLSICCGRLQAETQHPDNGCSPLLT